MTTTYDPQTALLVVDVQHDFAHPEGSLFVPGGEQVVGRVNQEIHAARRAGATIVYTQDWHPPRTPHFTTDGGTWPVHCVRDTWGAALHEELEVVPEALRISKGTGGEDGYSAFSVRDPETGEQGATELERLLRERDIERVVVVGLAQDVCVRATALDAARLGFAVEVLGEATRPVELQEGDGQRALEEMAAAGATVR